MNLQRFRQVLAYIEAHPEEWNQENCNACFLFHAAKMNGELGMRAHAGFGHDFLDLKQHDEMWDWIISPDRKLDDFRNIARRPYG